MEIVFYDLETTIPAVDIIEFGAIVLDKVSLYEKDDYLTLIYSDKITKHSIDCNGITFSMVKNAPEFKEVAERIFDILDGKIWAGHNIKSFDNPCIKNSFARINKKAPEPIGTIDTLHLLRRHFGKRTGNFKLATLGDYFGLGEEKHRSIEDCRMNIEVLKKCSMTLFLEENAEYASFDDVHV